MAPDVDITFLALAAFSGVPAYFAESMRTAIEAIRIVRIAARLLLAAFADASDAARSRFAPASSIDTFAREAGGVCANLFFAALVFAAHPKRPEIATA